MWLGSACWGTAFVSMYAEVREGVAVAVAYYGKVVGEGRIQMAEKVFPTRTAMRKWVNSSGRLFASA